jgi:hypothetical protein
MQRVPEARPTGLSTGPSSSVQRLVGSSRQLACTVALAGVALLVGVLPLPLAAGDSDIIFHSNSRAGEVLHAVGALGPGNWHKYASWVSVACSAGCRACRTAEAPALACGAASVRHLTPVLPVCVQCRVDSASPFCDPRSLSPAGAAPPRFAVVLIDYGERDEK